MRTSKYLRKATRKFTCACCDGLISKGEEYVDFETVDYSDDDTIIIKHKRLHKNCDRPKVHITKDQLPMPVGYLGTKEWLVGKLFFEDRWYLLTEDWCNSKYYKRKVMHDCKGNDIKPEDVEL